MTTEIFNRGVSTQVLTKGFRTELFGATPGSYASNAVYGSSADLVDSYYGVSVADKGGALIRSEGNTTVFTMQVVLDRSQADPSTAAGNEIRMRTYQPAAVNTPAAYLKRLPLQSGSLPIFTDVEIIDPATGAVAAGFPSVAGVGQLQARLLYGGELALVVVDNSAGPPSTVTALTAADLTPLFGAGAGTELLITVRGEYHSQRY